MDIAPRLYKLAWRKNRTVREELQEENWTRGLWRMQDAGTIAEFVHLWHLVQQVQLREQEDTIAWMDCERAVHTEVCICSIISRVGVSF